MSMKNPAKLIAALIILVVVAVIVVLSLSGGDPVKNPYKDGRVRSDDGTEELMAFFSNLADEEFGLAVAYVMENCDGSYCMMEKATTTQIEEQLKTWCVDHVCQDVEIDTPGEDMGSGVRSHEVAFIDETGKREPLCFDDACSVTKLTSSFRVRKADDGLWYVVDEPPLRVTKNE